MWKNFKGTATRDDCQECSQIDDEEHRLNDCRKWSGTNNVGKIRVNFANIYREDRDVFDRLIDVIENVWELRCQFGKKSESKYSRLPLEGLRL